jgi:hypothetical protein
LTALELAHASPVFVGRDAELATLTRAIGAATLYPPSMASPLHGYTIAFSLMRPHSRGTAWLASDDRSGRR